MPPDTLAHALRCRRIHLGHNQILAAEAMGVGLRTLKGWETGSRPRLDAIPLLADYLGFPFGEVVTLALGETDVPPRS